MKTASTTTMTPVFRRLLRAYPLFTDRSTIGEHRNWLGVSFSGSRQMIDPGFDINIEGDTIYLLSIMLPPEHRGKGLGSRLYELIVEAAGELGCSRVVQTPSGYTPSGETRRGYLFRHGWLPLGNEVYRETAKAAVR